MYNEFYYKKDRLNQIRGFCAVVQNECSIRKAAEKMGLEHPSISKQVIALERDLGIKLFIREKNKKLTLTKSGKKFYKNIIPTLQNMDGVFKNFSKQLEEEENNNLIIASFDIVLKKMIPFLAEFKIKYPKLNISLLNISKTEALKRLVNKEIDLIFYPSDINEICPVELDEIKVSRYKSCLILPKGHELSNKNENEITREDISKYPFGVLSNSLYTKSFKNFVEEYNLRSPINFENGTIDFLKEMVQSNLCVSIINDIYLNEIDKNELIIKSTDNYMPTRFYYNFSLKGIKNKIIAEDFLDIVKINHEKIFH